jgi:glycosyltransferase involved in cell wall biosynthesis
MRLHLRSPPESRIIAAAGTNTLSYEHLHGVDLEDQQREELGSVQTDVRRTYGPSVGLQSRAANAHDRMRPHEQTSTPSTATACHRRALVIVQGSLGDRPAGPEIRGLELSRGFAERHEVTIAASTETRCSRYGFPVVPRSRASLVAELRRHDIVIGPLLPPYAMTVLSARRCIRVADLYDPVDLELGTLAVGWKTRRKVAEQHALRRLQLRWSDVVVCANDRQRERALHDIRASGRSGPGPVLVTVPMGLPESPPTQTDRPLRDAFGIPIGDPLVLWWGTVWRWLDAETAIRAMERLAQRRPTIRLVITAGRPPNPATDALNTTEEARALARDLGLLDRNVYFFEDWVPYDERHRYLADADIGLSLHAAGPEAALAARARYMDFLWAGVPSILAEGDELADEMAAAAAARLVGPRDPDATAAAIETFVDDAAGLRAAREGCAAMAQRYRWSTLVDPLVRTVDAMQLAGGSGRDALRIAHESGRFYARRLIGKGLGAD